MIAGNAGNDKPASDRLRRVLSSNCTRVPWVEDAHKALRDRAPDFAPSSETPGAYVGQDFGELSRVAVLESGAKEAPCPDLSAIVQDDEGGRDLRTQPGV